MLAKKRKPAKPNTKTTYQGIAIILVGVAIYFLGGLLHHYVALVGWLIGIIGTVVFVKSAFNPRAHKAELETLRGKQPWDR
jgi:multisubunit Na+/H+ antiporter MnhG subunit